MCKRIEKFLLVLVTVALAAAPLRATLALPLKAVADAPAHCAHMPADMHGVDQARSMHDAAGDPPDHGCGQGCDGRCCDGKCATCAHVAIALPAAISGTPDRYGDSLPVTVSDHYAGRTVHPPFRPPILLS